MPNRLDAASGKRSYVAEKYYSEERPGHAREFTTSVREGYDEPMRFRGACLLAGLVAFAHGVGAAAPPKLRLDDSVRPVRYTAELTLLPAAPGFSGAIDIEVELRKPTSLIWLNATEIQVAEATVETGGKIQNASVEPGDRNFIGLRIPSEAPAGAAKLHMRYEGKISPRNTAGIFQGRDGGESYCPIRRPTPSSGSGIMPAMRPTSWPTSGSATW
jgi:hypothetical protein